MTQTALKALKASIAHWRRMATGQQRDGEQPFSNDCPLCQQFQRDGACWDCPIKQRTGRGFCSQTPYHAAVKEYDRAGFSPEFRRAALKELAFLRSLLPRKTRKTTKTKTAKKG